LTVSTIKPIYKN